MTTGWRCMITWWGAGLAIVTLLLARSLHRVIGKICRPREGNRSGTLEILSGKDNAKFEIIAVPGLGAHPYHTWEATRKTQASNATECQTTQSRKVHLLKDLLAHDFPDARIWNFAHESNWLIDAPIKTTEEIGKCLLKAIKDKRPSAHLPIIFIGHSLGGIVIKQALCTSDSQDIVDDTAGIIFLGTPHQGSSVSIAGAVLAALTGFLGSDTTLLLSLKNHGAQLSNLADAFDSRIAPNGPRQRKIPITSFYETKKTYLFGLSLGLVVSRDSAKVHADACESHSIETDHSGLNKCGGLTDTLFTALTAAIRRLKTPSLLEQADTWIRDKHYTANRLRIERLSGKSLSIDQCYINLALVEQSGQDAGHSKKGGTAPSPFSILSRQKVETPDETMQVELAALFNKRNGSDGRPVLPRRILIRGRAGVGKTTLCKKIIHEFYKGTWDKWSELFDRVLWVPLRNLKLPERRNKSRYTLEHLFRHEFLLPKNEPNLAGALFRALNIESSKTLFLLDGLDEVSQDLTGEGSMPRFLDELLRQPHVIITSRPSAKPVPNLDLELETIGFSPDQVKEYIEKSFTERNTAEIDQAKVDKVQSFLRKHWLIQGLARIPIQLDALCYTWDGLIPDAVLSTMTCVYKEIELKLWKKDILRLEKKHDGKVLTEEEIKLAGSLGIQDFVMDEADFLECLAFTGLHNDIIDFKSNQLDDVVRAFGLRLFPQKSLPKLSFLRTSDPLSEYCNRNYHFIHLTFQEYFAARYFVRQWKHRAGQLLFVTLGIKGTERRAGATEFLRKHKYTARYDVFWRFVAGLLDGSEQALKLINTVEEEPLDLLGPTHQRLVMHCLSEISGNLPKRAALEKRLAQWLLFECRFNHSARLASEVEFPEAALKTALLSEASDTQAIILQSLANRALIPPSVLELVAKWLDDEDWNVRKAAVGVLRSALPDEVLAAVARRLDDEDLIVRQVAITALGGRSALPDKVLVAVAARLEDEELDVRGTAIEALGESVLSEEVLAAVARRLNDKGSAIRRAAIGALGWRSTLPDEVLTAVAERLDDDDFQVRRAAVMSLPDEVLVALVERPDHRHSDVRETAIQALGGRLALPDEVLGIVVRQLNNKDEGIRRAAIEVIGQGLALSEKVLDVVAERLDDEDLKVRWLAVKLLGGRLALPSKVLAAVARRVDDENPEIREAAIAALGRRSELSNKVVEVVAARLHDKDLNVRETAIEALGGRSALPDNVLKAVVRQLKDKTPSVRSATIRALGRRLALSNKVLVAVVRRLNDRDLYVRLAAIRAMGQRLALADKVPVAVLARLNDEDSSVRCATIQVLSQRSVMPDEVLAAVARRLDDEDFNVRRVAIKALGERSALPDKVLVAVAARLEDEESDVRSATVDILMSNYDKLCRTSPPITSLYRALLERSFKDQTSLYIENGKAYVNMPDGIRELNTDVQQISVKDWINRARPADCPSTGGGET